MFGSLRKKLEEVSAQVNMFDGGKTAATVRANRNQAPPAQTIRSQPKQNSLVGRNDNQPGFQITNNSFTRGLSRGFDQANMFDNNRTWQQRTPTGTQSIGQEAKRIVNTPTTPKKYWDNGVGKAVNTAIAGTNRAAAGIGQDLGGLVDYVTPGKGTNRVTSYFRDRGAMWDDKAKEAGVDGLGYKVSQVPLNVASYMVPGSVAKGVGSIPRVASTGAKVANIASKTPGVSSVLSAGAKLSTKLDDIAKTGNIAQRTGARLASSYMSKPAMADVAFDTIQSAGNRTSKGQDNSFGTLAVDTGLSLATQGGVNLAGQALKPVTTRLVQTAKNLPSPAQVTTRLAGASRKIDETLFTPRLNRLDLDTRDALIAYSDRLVGADPYITGKVESDLIKKVRAIGDANGVDLTNGTVVQQLDRIEALLNGYKGSSGALNSKPVPVDPLEALKQEAKRFGYDKGYTEEGQIANTIDELMKEQNAVREVGIPLYDKYKSKLDGTKTVTEMMTPAELKAYRAAEAKSEKASKLLKDYFDYKKGNNQAQKEAAVPKTNKTNLVLKERKLPGGKDGPIEALKAEARKYKSAEEFVKAQLNAAPGNDLETLSTISRPIPISQLPSSELGLKGRTVSSWESRIKSGQRPVVELNFEGVGVKVRDGNHRLQAYKNLGFTEVPAVTKRQLTDLYDQAHSQPTPKAEAPDPLESLKQEAKRFGYDKGYTEEGQIANTIDELMKEQNAVREVGIPLYDKYKSKLDGTKTVTEMMTPAELKAYRAAEAKSEKASKLLKDYFDYKKGNNQAQKEAAVPKTNKTNLVLKERKLPGGKDGPIEALKAEARKYKSAEEFVKAQLNAAPGNDLETLSTISRPIPISQLPSSELGLKGRTVSSWESRIKSGQRPVVELNFEGVGVKVRDGNHRLQAYKNLGFTEVPAVTKRQLTDLYDQAHSQPTPKAEAPDPLESLKQEARKEYDFFSNSKYFADNDNVIKTLAELNDKSTPTYQALDLLRQERGLGGVEKNLIDISKRTDATNKQTAQAKQVAKKDLDGFTDDKSSLQRGKIEKTLDSQIRYNGEVMTKRDYIRKLIDEGYVPDEKTGSIYSPNDRSNYQAVTKTEADYARHLYNQATAPKTEGVAPQPTKGGGVEVNGSNWREAVDNQKFGKDADTNANILGEKQRTLRAVAEVSRSDKELGDILNRAEQLHKEGYLGDNANLAWDIMQNPASSKATKARATKLYKDITKPALAPKVEVPTGFSKSLEDAGFSTPQSRVGRNKVQAGSQARTPNQLKSANKGQSFESSESLASYPEGKPKKAQPETVEAKQSPKQSDLSSSRSSDNIIDLESIDVNDPFGNRSLTQKVKNEFNRMFIDEDAEMISLLRKVEKETGSKDMVEKWLQDTDMVRGSNSIANSKIRSNENLKGAIHGLSKKEVKQLDEYASARSELYNLENGLSASKSKEKLQSIINKHEAKYGKRFESLNNYYNDLAKDLHEAGIISKEQMDTWAKNKDYVRVQRDMEDLLEPSVGKSRSRSFGSTSTSKKRTGSKRDILSPTETAFKRTQEIQLEIQRNKAASNIIDVLEKHGLSERIPQSQAHGKNVIKRFKDGKVEYFATNKDIKRVIENVRPFELGVIAKVVSFPTRVFKAGTTGLSAPFAVTNYARDQVGSAIYSKSVMATHNPKNIVSGIYQGVKDFGGVGNSDIWEKFVKHAGDQTSFDMTRGTLGSKSIMNEVRRGSLKQRGITLVDPRYLVRNVEDLISITEKSTRYQNFKGIYEKAIKEGLGEDVAIQKATQAALQNSVNFGRAGSVAKAANLILPYFNAGIQGSRNLGRSFRDRPVATAAKSVGFVGIPMVALTLHNYSDPETREIYSNIDETEKQDNFIIVLPGAKQRDDGTYEGILKIPKPQGYRELLDPLRSYAESFASGEDPKDVASMLKDMLPAISGPIQTEDTGKLISSLTPQALKPALQAHLNKDLYWGNDVVPDYMIAGTDDPTERARKNTSGMARFIANRLNVSPIAVEKFIIDSTGSLGRYGINAVDSELARRDIIPDEQIGGRSISSDFKRRTTEARGIENKNMTDGQRYFRDREEVTKSLKPQQKTAWESYNQSNKNFKGEVVFDKSSFAQKQAKASAYVQFPELFETDKKLDKKARDRGEPGNPLYDLNYKQAIKVVLKKALPPGSKDSELDALYNQPWYADFKAKESQYYDKIFAGKEKEDSGYPQRSPELQKKIDYYYTLPKGTGQRSDFLKSNPDVIQHWDAVEAWTNGERAKIGLDPTTKDDSFGFGSGGGRGGRRGRSKAGYDYTKALFDANVGSVSMTKDLQSILEKYMKANAKISKKA